MVSSLLTSPSGSFSENKSCVTECVRGMETNQEAQEWYVPECLLQNGGLITDNALDSFGEQLVCDWLSVWLTHFYNHGFHDSPSSSGRTRESKEPLRIHLELENVEEILFFKDLKDVNEDTVSHLILLVVWGCLIEDFQKPVIVVHFRSSLIIQFLTY